MIPGKAIASFFFEVVQQDDGNDSTKSWQCKKCGDQKLSQKGYTNLRCHAAACVGKTYEKDLQDHLDKVGCFVDNKGNIQPKEKNKPKTLVQQAINSFVTTNNNELRAYTWIRWLACRNMPLTEIENDLTRDLAKSYKPFSIKTIRKYILATSSLVVDVIAAELKRARVLTLLLDGWTADGASTHYIAIFAGYQHPDTQEYTEVLLAMQPTLDEEGAMDADAHEELLDSTLELYKLTKSNVLCLIGDNCNTNKCLAKQWDIPLVGCASHRFNLAVKHWMEKQPGLLTVIKKLSVLMSKACNLRSAHTLRHLTLHAFGKELRAQQMNETRWTSIFTMVERYLRIKTQLEAIPTLAPFCLVPTEAQMLKDAQVHLEIFKLVTVEIQAKGMDLAHCRKQFDTLLECEDYADMSKYLAEDAKIIDFQKFESGVRKIMAGEALDPQEAIACAKLKEPAQARNGEDSDDDSSDDGIQEMSVADKLKKNSNKRRKICTETNKNQLTKGYIDVGNIICATSNCCERLFSEAKYIMLPHRRSMSPILFCTLKPFCI